MRDINEDGGPAFPARSTPEHTHGMSLRDYFAGQALGGILSNAGTLNNFPVEIYAQAAYEFADAMLKARK